MNTKKDWKAKLARPHFFKVQSGKITVWSASWSARLVCRIKLADKLQKFSSFRDFGLAFGCILNGLCELSDKLDSSLIANIALLHMYPVTCIDVIESAAVSSLCSSHDSVCVRYFEFWCYYLFSRRDDFSFFGHFDQKTKNEKWNELDNSEVMVWTAYCSAKTIIECLDWL